MSCCGCLPTKCYLYKQAAVQSWPLFGWSDNFEKHCQLLALWLTCRKCLIDSCWVANGLFAEKGTPNNKRSEKTVLWSNAVNWKCSNLREIYFWCSNFILRWFFDFIFKCSKQWWKSLYAGRRMSVGTNGTDGTNSVLPSTITLWNFPSFPVSHLVHQ